MILTPTAKPIRIRIVSGGEEHSSLDSLRKNFSIRDLRPLVSDGRLTRWLRQKGESNIAELISKFQFNSDEKAPDREETMNFISIFFPEYKNENLDSLIKLLKADNWNQKNIEHLEKYLRILPSTISEALTRHKLDSSRYSKEDWIDILIRASWSEVRDILKDRNCVGILNLIAEDDLYKILSLHAERGDDTVLFEIGYMLVHGTTKYSAFGMSYIHRSLEMGNKIALEYIQNRSHKSLFDKFPNGTALLSEYEKDANYLSRFMSYMEKQYELNKPLPNPFNLPMGKYETYLQLSHDLHGYMYASSDFEKRKYVKRIINNNPKVALDYNLNREYFGKKFRDLSFRDYLRYIINLIKNSEYNEK